MRKSTKFDAPIRRAPLTRERILNTALELADNSGLDAVSMRQVAQGLGVEAMSLYKHVANKDDVLDGLVELVVAQMSVPPPETGWKEALRERAYTVRKILNCHPWAANLLESRAYIGPTRLRHHDSMLGILRNAGFSVELAFNTMIALTSYVYGFVILEQAHHKPEKNPKTVESAVPMIAPAEHPHIFEMLKFVVAKNIENARPGAQTTSGFFADFDFGLNHLIDGLESILRK